MSCRVDLGRENQWQSFQANTVEPRFTDTRPIRERSLSRTERAGQELGIGQTKSAQDFEVWFVFQSQPSFSVHLVIVLSIPIVF